MLINTTGPLKKNSETRIVSSSFKTQPLTKVFSKLYGLETFDMIEPGFSLLNVSIDLIPTVTDTVSNSLQLTSLDVTASNFHTVNIPIEEVTSSLHLTGVTKHLFVYHEASVNDDVVTRGLQLTGISKQELLVIHHQHTDDAVTRSLTLTSIVKS
jgi:hypothetical protein